MHDRRSKECELDDARLESERHLRFERIDKRFLAAVERADCLNDPTAVFFEETISLVEAEVCDLLEHVFPAAWAKMPWLRQEGFEKLFCQQSEMRMISEVILVKFSW